MAKVPSQHRWVFWDVDARRLDTARDAVYILARVLESGGIAEVRWLIDTYGKEGIHRFLRDVGHPELSRRTLGFWRAVFRAEDETWASPPAFRRSSAAPPESLNTGREAGDRSRGRQAAEPSRSSVKSRV